VAGAEQSSRTVCEVYEWNDEEAGAGADPEKVFAGD